jgi:hypothetical protein
MQFFVGLKFIKLSKEIINSHRKTVVLTKMRPLSIRENHETLWIRSHSAAMGIVRLGDLCGQGTLQVFIER